ncbi:alpha-1A adrenergic receptor-like [Branchiostoma floridae x Branchiostoma japonicum]
MDDTVSATASTDEDEDMLTPSMTLTVILTVTSSIGALSNLVICLVIICAHARNVPSDWFMGNLSFVDLTFAGVTVPIRLARYLLRGTGIFGGLFGCKLCMVLPKLCLTNSVFTMLAMAYERYRSTAKFNKPKLTGCQTGSMLVLVWFVSCMLCLYDIVSGKNYLIDMGNSTEPAPVYITDCWFPELGDDKDAYSYVFAAFGVATPLISIAVFYALLVGAIRTRGFQSPNNPPSSPQQQPSAEASTAASPVARVRTIRVSRSVSGGILHEIRQTNMVAALVVVFVLCWVPLFVLPVMQAWTEDSASSDSFILQLHMVLVTVRTILDPVIYTCSSRAMLCCRKRGRVGEAPEDIHLGARDTVSDC